MKRPFFGALIVLTFSCATVSAQVLPFQYFNLDRGLVSNSASVLFQDSRGYMWIGTGEGISVFDGTAFRNLTVSDGLARNGATSISESRVMPGVMFVGTFGGGVSRFENGKFSTLLPDSSNLARQVYAVEEDFGGTLWCVTAGGLYIMSNGKFNLLRALTDGSGILVTRDSLVWVASGRTILVYPQAHIDNEEVWRIALPGRGRVVAMKLDRAGFVWVSTSDSLLVQFEKRNMICQRRIPFGYARSITDDAEGMLWLATQSGLVSVQREQASTSPLILYSTDNGLRRNSVVDCLVDFENNLWGAYWDEGIFRLSDRNVFRFPLKGVPESYNNCKSVTDLQGHIWTVTTTGLVETWKESGRWQSFLHNIRIDPNGKSALSIARDKKGRLWIDTKKDIECYVIDSSSSTHLSLRLIKKFATGIQLPATPRFFFIIDSQDNLWAAMLGQGVYKMDPWNSSAEPRYYTASDGLPSNDVRVLYEDRKGNMWFGTMANGLGVMPAGSEKVLQSIAGLPDELIRGVIEDRIGRIWVGTRRNGIGILENDPARRDSIRTLSVRDGLLASAVWALAWSEESDLIWAGTHLGAQSIDATTMLTSRPKRALMGQAVNSLGVYHSQFLWFVTTDALTVYEYRHGSLNTTPPPTYITRLGVNANDVDMSGRLEFTHDKNILLFEYIGISYRETEALRYQYRLAGLDVDWHPPTAQRTVTYASIAPGAYTFEVRAINADGVMSALPAKVSFTILPAFWQRWWFLACVGVAIAGSAIFVFRQRLEKVKREQRTQQEFSRRLIESQETERKRIAGELHDSLGQNLLVIRNRALLGLKDSALNRNVRDQLDQISSVATQAIDGVREIAYDLRPYQLDRLGLTKAIASITSGLATPVQFSMNVEPIDDEVGKEKAIHVYRIVQEGINNILKHSGASEAQIVIHVEESNIRITISDNGRGMPQDSPGITDGRQGFGLVGIAERAKVLNGTVAIGSMPGKGTTLTVVIPRADRI